MRHVAVLCALLTTACGGPTAVDGDIGTSPFTRAKTAVFGGPFLVIADEAIPCNEMGWVSRTYTNDEAADGRRTFTALQIAFTGNSIAEGSFLADRAQGVVVDGLENDPSGVLVHHAREGTIDITSVSESHVDGTFSIAFGDSGVAGTFSADPCVNLRP